MGVEKQTSSNIICKKYGDDGSGCFTSTVRKQRLFYTCSIYGSFFVLGWLSGMFGPSFIDLQLICDVNVEQGSWILTTLFFGMACGSIIGGVLHDKVNRKLHFCTCLLGLAALMAVTLWCTLYWTMLAVHFAQGVAQGLIDTAGNAEILMMWRNERMVYFGLNLAYIIGSFISPLAVAPFVTVDPHNNSTFPGSFKHLLVATHGQGAPGPDELSVIYSGSSFNTSDLMISNEKSMIYIPFSITAAVVASISFPFLFVYCTYDESTMEEKGDNPVGKLSRILPIHVKIAALVVIGAILFMFISVNDTFPSYLTVYCVEYLSWSTTNGAILTYVVNTIGMLTVIVAFLLKCLNTIVFTGIHCVFITLALVGMLLSSIYRIDIGIWISASIFGYFRSVLFVLFFTWTNEYITPVTGRITSAFMLASTAGGSINPILLGYLMEEFSDLWFCYLFIIESGIVLVLYVVAVYLTRNINSKYSSMVYSNILECEDCEFE